MEFQKLLLSQDGSHTIYSEKYDAHYHSVYGAIDESIHVFISAGLYYKWRQGARSIIIFEMGFGTGLNAYLTYLEGIKLGMNIHYITVDSDPVSSHDAEKLNFHKLVGEDNNEVFLRMHSAEWNKEIAISQNFSLAKQNINVEELSIDRSVDIIYYDAFAPTCQPELWEVPLHQKFYNSLKSRGILVTYCAQGQFKRNLKLVGYKLELLNGPHRKREMVRALKA